MPVFNIQKQSFEYVEKLAKTFYRKNLLGTSVKCKPVGKVYFTHTGWNHILDKDRSINELITRLFAIEAVKIVLQNTKELAGYEKRVLDNKTIEYFVVDHYVDGVTVRVIVQRVNSGQAHFLSCVWRGSIK